jgi:hypothetical protein
MAGSYVELAVYVPLTHVNAVKEALAAAGPGRLGAYDSCMWGNAGTGQFRPLEGSNPFLGQHGSIEQVPEMKIECIVEEAIIRDVISSIEEGPSVRDPGLSLFSSKN